MKAIWNGGIYFLKAYVQLLLYFPRLLLQLNLNYNPFFILARKLVHRALLTMDPEATAALRSHPVVASVLVGTGASGPATSNATPTVVLGDNLESTAAAQPQQEDETVDETTVADAQETAEVSARSAMRWLDPGEFGGQKIALVSYPRSGNSLMRGLLEKITGVYTGSDTRPDRTLSQQLQEFGMKGEGVVDDSVWFVKTHFPERVGWKPFKIQKAILVVRNPWDAIDSYFNMTLTNSHNKTLHESQYERFADRWDGMIRNEIDVWMKFHRYWTSKVDIPIIVVRYEDLLVHRAETLRRVFLFLTDRPTIEGTEWEDRIRDVMQTSGENSGPYVPRSGKIGASFKHYSDEQFQYILKVANLPLKGFGYDPVTQDFPNSIPLPRRQVKPGKRVDAELEVPIDPAQEIRKRNDLYGRFSTWYRKALTEPVLARDGTELNIEEVLQARQKKQQEDEAKKMAMQAN